MKLTLHGANLNFRKSLKMALGSLFQEVLVNMAH